MQWGPDADAKLFMHVLRIHNVKLDYTALAMAMGNDVTPKALTHRIAKLRSMAQDASTPVAGSTSGLSLPEPNKRNTTAKRAPRATTAAPDKKGTATAANKAPIGGGTKRTATGAVKDGNGKGNGKKASGGSPLQNGGDGDEEGDEGVVERSGKKVKGGYTGMGAGSVVKEDEGADADTEEVDDGGVGYSYA